MTLSENPQNDCQTLSKKFMINYYLFGFWNLRDLAIIGLTYKMFTLYKKNLFSFYYFHVKL